MPEAMTEPTLGRRLTVRRGVARVDRRAACLTGLRAGWRARAVAAPRDVDALRPRLAGGVRPAMGSP
jgi:hypothetical protein